MNKNDIDSLLAEKGFNVTDNTPLITIAVKGQEKITLRFNHKGDCISIICERIDTSDSLKLNAKEKYGAVITSCLRGDDLVFTLEKTNYKAEIIL